MNTPPLQWTIDVNSIGRAPSSRSYEATSAELEALQRYVEAEDMTSFRSDLKVVPLGKGKFRISGMLHADLVQASVISLEKVPASIEETFSVDYWPAELIEEAGGEAATIDEGQPEALEGASIPIGKLLCELLAVSIDPYPRNEGDTFDWGHPQQETEASPFAKLASLRREKNGGKEADEE
jgi:hypothetical protein